MHPMVGVGGDQLTFLHIGNEDVRAELAANSSQARVVVLSSGVGFATMPV